MNIATDVCSTIFFAFAQTMILMISSKRFLRISLNPIVTYLVISSSCLIVIFNVKLYLVTSMIACILIVYIFCKNFFASVLVSIMTVINFFVVNVVISIVVTIFLQDWNKYNDTFLYNFLFSMAYLLLTSLVFLLLSKININLNLNEYLKIKPSKIYLIIFINLCSFLICICLFSYTYDLNLEPWQTMSFAYIFLTVLFVLNCVISLIIYMQISNAKVKEASMKLEKELTEQHKETIQKLYDDTMDFKHDYLKFYKSMALFIEQKNMDVVSDYFNNHIVPLSESISESNMNSKSLALIEDIPLQSLLYTYMIKQQNSDCNLIVDVHEKISHLNINIFDLCRVMGIFIDNAIEASQKVQNGQIHIGIVRLENQTLLVCRNTIEKNSVSIGSLHSQAKSNGRGRGLTIAKKIISEYKNTVFDINIKEQEFTVELYVKDKKE